MNIAVIGFLVSIILAIAVAFLAPWLADNSEQL